MGGLINAVYPYVLAVHVLANVAAFGVLFAWPWLLGGSTGAHRSRSRVLGVVTTRCATVALLAGAFLATVRQAWGELWVVLPFTIMIVLLGVVGGYLTPKERRLAELAELADRDAHSLLARSVTRVATGCAGLVAVAVMVMVVKPGA